MKILLIHPHDLWADEEPWTSRIRNIAKQLVLYGHEVRVVHFAYPGSGEIKPKDTSFGSFRLLRAKRAIFHTIYTVTQHAKWADVIHFQKCFAHAAIPAIYAHVFTNTPIHYDWDDWELQIYNYDPPSYVIGKFLGFLENIMPSFVDTLSVASAHLKQLAIECGFPDDRIYDAHVCADLDVFKPMESDAGLKKLYGITKPVVMYMGQLHGAQYAEMMIHATERILETEDVIFLIVGSGAREHFLLEQVVKRGLTDRVIFTGSVDHHDVPRYLSLADVAVACFEDNDITRCKSPLKIVEYMACGKAIVASDVGEVSHMLGGCGLLTASGNIEELAQGIITLLRDPGRRKTMECTARANAEKRFAWSVTTQNLLCAYAVGINAYAEKKRSFVKEIDISLVQMPPWTTDVPPLGVAWLAAHIRANGYTVAVCDINVTLFDASTDKGLWDFARKDEWSNAELLCVAKKTFIQAYTHCIEKVLSDNPRIIGLSVTQNSLLFARGFAAAMKAIQPDVIIIAGGWGCYNTHERALLAQGNVIDGFVVGEGEAPVVALIQNIKAGRGLSGIQGLIVNGTDVTNYAQVEVKSDLENSAFPTYEEFSLSHYKQPIISMITSRGCVGTCAFCNDRVYQGRFRMRKPEHIFEEIAYHVRHNHIRHFSFNDLLINGSLKHLEAWCDYVLEAGLDIKWCAQALVRTDMQGALLTKIRTAGCYALQLGIESGATKILRSMKKRFDAQEAEAMLRLIHESGVQTWVNLIVGFPGEREEEFQETLDFVARNNRFIDKITSVNTCNVVFHSDLMSKKEEYGIVLPDTTELVELSWSDRNGNNDQVRKQRLDVLTALINKHNIPVGQSNSFVTIDD